MTTQSDIKTQLFWTTAQLSERWHITPMTLRRWRKAGKIQAHHLGRGIRFSLADIEKIETESRA
ncbi:helix-turn-helix domain-containing protein [Prosthecobacter sp.]|uniref:helix-turn-helix domain-containing protein n=1 Tax=Prosthecobacter sp. TaxID=1965333 RepID=UPI0037CBA2AC